MLLTTMGLSGVAFAGAVSEAEPASAAAYGVAPGTIKTIASATGSVTLDLSVADTFVCTVTGDVTFTFGAVQNPPPSPMVAVEPTVILTQDSTGGHSIHFTNVTWLPSGATPAFPAAAGQSIAVCFLTADFGGTVFGEGAIQAGGGFGVYGDGSDSAIVLDGKNSYPFLGQGTGTASNYYWAWRDVYASSLTIEAGCTLQLAGGGTGPMRLFCSGTLTNNGGFLMAYPNNPSSGAVGGSNLATGTLVPGANAPSGKTANAAGAAGTGVIGSWGRGALAAGGAGGANGSGTVGGAGGNAAAPAGLPGGLTPRAVPQVVTMSVTDGSGNTHFYGGGASGGAGAGDGTYAGGAGGPGGNPLFIAAQTIVNAGTIKTAGGDGGTAAGGNAGGGGGGQGGPIIIVTSSLSTVNGGSITNPGGSAGLGKGTGKPGSAGGAGWTVLLAN